MANLFFYGTLRHVPLLEVVLGRSAAEVDLIPATLADHAVLCVVGHDFPIIVEVVGDTATGLLVRGLTETDCERLVFYEGGFDYALKPASLMLADNTEAEAQVFFPEPGKWQSADPWSLRSWADRWGSLVVRTAQDVMDEFGRRPAQEVIAHSGTYRRLAAAWLSARARPADPNRDVTRDVLVHRRRRPYASFLALDEIDLQFRRYDGAMSPVLSRAALMVGEPVVVLPYDPVMDSVLLVEQFRTPVFLGGSRSPWVWEPIAGLIDPGETPETAARRESLEEAGLQISRLEPVGQAYSSTGSSSEYVHMFVGLADLSETDRVGGLAAEGEDIRPRVIRRSALMEGVDEQTYCDMPLLTCALWLDRHLDRLGAG